MAGSKRDRQRVSRQERLAAAAEARRRAQARRNMVAGSVAVVAVVLVGVVVLLLTRGDGSKKVATSSPTSATPTSVTPTSITPGNTSTTAAAAGSAGKPCVATSDPYPAGAPAVAVKVGPPPSQLVTEDVKVGTGATVATGQTVTVNYVGVACSTGKIFDSSYGPGKQSVSFPLGQVIKGWQTGIPGMKVGGQRLLGIPPDLAYGAQGQGPIGPNETLWFVVEVLKAG